jgi:glutathione S-transferase
MEKATAKLYGARGAPPSMSAQLMLEHKGMPYRRVNLLPQRHRKALARRGFPAGTVPALELDGQLVQTNRTIARALDAAVPDPPLFPADEGARRLVEEAEVLCDERLQPAVRRIALWTLRFDPDAVRFSTALGPLVPPRLPAFVKRYALDRALGYYGATAAVVSDDLRTVPRLLDRIDAWIAQGVLDGADLNAADFQIGPLVLMLLGVGDLGSETATRPVAGLARRILPEPV